MKTLCAVVLLVSSLSFADSFTTVQVNQKNGFVTLSPETVTPLKLSIGPSVRLKGRPEGYLWFSFPVTPATGIFTTTFTIDWTWPTGFTGPWTQTLMGYFDSTSCASPCMGMFLMPIPNFTGTRAGTIHFNWNGTDSETYKFTLMEPVPEPETWALFGIGILSMGGLWKMQTLSKSAKISTSS
jgi:hypothetical protein